MTAEVKHAPDALRVQKRGHRFQSDENGLNYSYNTWELRNGAKLVRRFAKRSDAYAALRNARGAS